MADEFRIQITEAETIGGKLLPVLQTTGAYYLRVDDFSANTYTGTHIANGSWSFGVVQDGVYELWNATVKIESFGRKYIVDNEPDFKNVYVKAGGKVYTDTIEERTGAAGVTIDGMQIKDANPYTDLVREKTSGAGVTVDGVVCKDSGISCSGGANFTTTAPQSAVAPTSSNDLTPKSYVDGKIPYTYFVGRLNSDSVSYTLSEQANTLGGAVTLGRTAVGKYSLNTAALWNKDTVNDIIMTHGMGTSADSTAVIIAFEWVSTSLVNVYLYDAAGVATEGVAVDIEIKVFPDPAP